jgi:hypothetical protein
LAAALALSGLGACGGGDSKPKKAAAVTPAPTPAMTSGQFEALPLNTPRTAIEQRFGPPMADPESRIAAKYINGAPKHFRCVYYPVADAPEADFFRFCYKGGILQNKLAVTTVKKDK